MKFFIYPQLNGNTREVMIEHYAERLGEFKERFKVYGKRNIWIESNRPLLRRRGIKRRRPEYRMTTSDQNAALYFSELIKHIDAWVSKNLD